MKKIIAGYVILIILLVGVFMWHAKPKTQIEVRTVSVIKPQCADAIDATSDMLPLISQYLSLTLGFTSDSPSQLTADVASSKDVMSNISTDIDKFVAGRKGCQ